MRAPSPHRVRFARTLGGPARTLIINHDIAGPARATGRRPGRQRGFTLIELVMTLALVGIMAMAIVPFSELMVQRQKEQELSQALRQIRTALDAYKEASDFGSIQKDAGASGYPPTLDALATGVKDAKDPKGGLLMFLRSVPRDPFFKGDVQTPPAQTWALRAYGTPPDEPQAGADVFDVASTSDRVGINGVPYKQW